MLHIILLILKIIGIVLLCIIGILLLVAVCALFVPVRYKVRLMREEGVDKPPVVIYAKATWLLHLVNVLVRYPANQLVRARIFIFTVFRIPKGEKRTKKVKKSEKQSNTKQAGDKENSKTSEEIETDVSAEADAVTNTQDQKETIEKEPIFEKNKNIFSKIKQFIERIKEFFKNIQYTIRKFCDKIKTASDNIQYYREVVESVPFRQSADLCWRELGWLLKKLKPDKFEADFIVGMEDPATTGEILAICGILYPLIGQHIRVVGDFDCDKTHIEGQLYIRGRIKVITFIRAAVRIYFNKDIRKLVKMFKKEDV